jgi:hypothetical protein
MTERLIFEDYKNQRDTVELYENIVDSYSQGPQIEGLATDELQEALKDPETEYIEIKLANNRIKLPFLVKLEHAHWVNQKFFSDRGYKISEIMYCVLPQSMLNKLASIEYSKRLAELSDQKGNLRVLVDYPEFSKHSYLMLNMPYSFDPLLTSNNTPAATYHYTTTVQAKPEGFKNFKPTPGIRRISSDEIPKHFERIWDIYDKQFKGLVEDHPIAGALSKDELLNVITSPHSRLTAYFDKNNILQTFGYVVEDLRLCPWLNLRYYDSMAQGLPVNYMSGIASSPDSHTINSGIIMNSMMYEALKLYSGKFFLAFECSNKSATYIPRLVHRAFEQSQMIDFCLNELKHYYQLININTQHQSQE